MHRLSSLMQTLMRSRRAVWQLVISGVSCKWSSTTSTCNTASPLSMQHGIMASSFFFITFFYNILISEGLVQVLFFCLVLFLMSLLLSFLWWVRHSQKNVKLKCMSHCSSDEKSKIKTCAVWYILGQRFSAISNHFNAANLSPSVCLSVHVSLCLSLTHTHTHMHDACIHARTHTQIGKRSTQIVGY